MTGIEHERLIAALRASIARARAARVEPLPADFVARSYVCPCRFNDEMCDDCWNAP